jgi:hypothetical protein
MSYCVMRHPLAKTLMFCIVFYLQSVEITPFVHPICMPHEDDDELEVGNLGKV